MNTLNKETQNSLGDVKIYPYENYTIRVKMEKGLLTVDISVLTNISEKSPDVFFKVPATIASIKHLERYNRTKSPIILKQNNSVDSFVWVPISIALAYARWLNAFLEIALANYIRGYLSNTLAELMVLCNGLDLEDGAGLLKTFIAHYRIDEKYQNIDKLSQRVLKEYKRINPDWHPTTITQIKQVMNHTDESAQATFSRYFGSV